MIYNLFSIAVPSFLGVKDFQFRQGRSDRETGAYIGGAVREDFEGVRTQYKLERFYSQARSSVEERYIDIVEVVSSILSAPTILPIRNISKIGNVLFSKLNQFFCPYRQNGTSTIYCLSAPSGCMAIINNPSAS